jgi:hypothetical protein
MIRIGRAHASNVKRWRDGQMALRDTLNKRHPNRRCHQP